MPFKRVVFTGEESPIAEVVTVDKNPEDYKMRDNEMIVHIKACAVNPSDIKHQQLGMGSKGTAVGCDYSGVVYKVGPKVEDFMVGDFVCGFVHGSFNMSAETGAFQEYAVVQSETAIKFFNLIESAAVGHINENKIESFNDAASIPSSLLTVGVSLYQGFNLRGKEHKDKWILIWGGTSSTGFLAIQVAKKLFGLKVITVANKNRYGNRLIAAGADLVVDYSSKNPVQQIKDLTNDKVVFAYDTVSVELTNFENVYNSLSDTLPSKINNLNFLKIDGFQKKNTELSTPSAFLLNGDDIPEWGLKSNEEIVQQGIEFKKLVFPLVNGGEIYHIPLEIYPNNLESANNALLQAKKGVSFAKIVFRV